MKQNRLLTLLVLLLTAATGAWADEVTYALPAGVTFQSGQTVEVKDAANNVVATITYGEAGGNAFNEVKTGYNVGGFTSYTSGNGTNGNKPGGTFYTITPKVDAQISVAVNQTEGKAFYIEEDGTVLSDYNGITPTSNYWGTYEFEAKADKAYKIYCSGSKLWFFGFTLIPTFSLSLKEGVKDADKWTAKVGTGDAKALPIGGLKGDGTETVTLIYSGRLKVKKVTATAVTAAAPAAGPTGQTIDLSNIPASALESDGKTLIVKDGTTLTGMLGYKYQIQIAAGATVTLADARIPGITDGANKTETSVPWAGLTCLGKATIILKDGTTNFVKGFFQDYPGIFVPSGSTLTIMGETDGTGALSASSNGWGAGIGGGAEIACGNIIIQGGVITAEGGQNAAAIGGAESAVCGNIIITGGTITATASKNTPGIGAGHNGSCGDIEIENTVTKVTSTKGMAAPNSIGPAAGNSSCGWVKIGGTKYYTNDAYVDADAEAYLTQETIVYPASN